MSTEARLFPRLPFLFLVGALAVLGSLIFATQASADTPSETTLSAEDGAKYRHVLSTGRPSQMYALAGDMEEQGHPDLAKKLYQALIDKYPDDAFAAKAIDRKAALRKSTTVSPSNAQGTENPSGPGIWMKDAKSQCAVWDPNPQPNASVTWDGACVQGRASGAGTVTWYGDGKVESTITGTIQNGQSEGATEIRWADGSIDECNKIHGLCEGRLTHHFPDGGILKGNVIHGKLEGQGIVHYANGSTYEGDFQNGRREGNGKITFANGHEFYGDFRADWPIAGVLKFPDGSTCEAITTKLADGTSNVTCNRVAKAGSGGGNCVSRCNAMLTACVDNAQSTGTVGIVTGLLNKDFGARKDAALGEISNANQCYNDRRTCVANCQ